MNVVVETNVAIAANGRDTHAGLACQYACVDLLEKLTRLKSKYTILLDDCELIVDEYKRHLNYRGQPGIGDAFFKYLHDHKYSGDRVALIRVTQNDDDRRGFDELPENTFDKSDRKFLAVAVVGNGTVFNAMDPDWHEHKNFIAGLGVIVEQLCPEHGCVVGDMGSVCGDMGSE